MYGVKAHNQIHLRLDSCKKNVLLDDTRTLATYVYTRATAQLQANSPST